jgi:tRNA A37 threonylcarbamoyltransferase TsaD
MHSDAVGVRKARKLAGSFNLPIIGIHHMEAHALGARYGSKNDIMNEEQRIAQPHKTTMCTKTY